MVVHSASYSPSNLAGDTMEKLFSSNCLEFCFIIPNIFVTGSKYGRYYPWSQPAYAMTPENQLGFTQTTQDLYLAVIGGFLLFSLAGVWNFMRTEMK